MPLWAAKRSEKREKRLSRPSHRLLDAGRAKLVVVDTTDVELRLVEVLGRWEQRLEAAISAWERMPAAERLSLEEELDEAGESDEWVRVLWSWWERSSTDEQQLLRDDVRFVAPVLRAARHAGLLEGDNDRAEAASHLLEAVERMEAILGIEPVDPSDMFGP
jgi:hypothetical protein